MVPFHSRCVIDKCDGKLCNRKNIVCSYTNPDWCLSTYLPSLSTITTVVVPPPGGMATATSGRNSVSVNSSVSSGSPSSIMSTSMHCVDRELLPTGRVRSCKTAPKSWPAAMEWSCTIEWWKHKRFQTGKLLQWNHVTKRNNDSQAFKLHFFR